MRKNLFTLQNRAFLFLSFILLFFIQAGFAQSTATFTGSGTWTCPAGVTSINVECWGAGGAGGSSNLNDGVGGGGGGGGYAKNTSVSVSVGTVYNITVGAGGVAVSAASGGNGSASSFGSTVIANGGNGGGLGNATYGITGGIGGTGNTGVTIYNGGLGGTSATNKSGGGGGGAGSTGAGGNGNQNSAGAGTANGGGIGAAGRTSSNDGIAGAIYGGGGSGAFGANGANSNKPGGNGAQGKVEITWTCTNYSLTSATTVSTACAGSGATITLKSTSLPTGTYKVTYNLSAPNLATGLTATMNFTSGSPGTGIFSTGALATVGTTTITITKLASGAVTGTATGTTDCNSAIAINNTAAITVNPIPLQPSIITGSATICAGTSQTYSVTNTVGDSYTWNIPAAGWSISSGQGTNSVTYIVGATGTVSVTASKSGCNGPARTLAVTVNGSSPGTYAIGPTGNFASIGAVITALQNGCTVAGAYIFEFQAAYLSSVETFPLSIPNISWMSATNTVTFRPAAGATNLSLTSSNATGTLTLNAAKYYIFDGRAGGTGTTMNLSIINTTTTSYSVQFINNAQYNTLKYCNIKGENVTLTEGVIQFSTSSTAGSGNSYNTIDNCDLGAGATAPANIIYSLGTSGRNNTANIISNSNIHDFFYPSGSGCNGILMDANTDSWSILNNSFYETSSRVFTSINSPWSAIQLSNKVDGNAVLINGNYIGGTAPNCGGTPMTITGSGNIRAIKIKGGPGIANTISGNTIANIAFTSSSVSVDALIYHSDGSLDITNNTIGATTGTGSITYTGTAGIVKGSSISLLFLGGAIVASVPEATVGGTVNVINNSIGAITVVSTDSTQLRVIDFEQSLCTFNITGNTIGNSTVNNIINNSKQTTLGMIGFAGKPGATHTISNNIIQNFFIPNTATTNQVVAIQTQGDANESPTGLYNITGNIIRDFNTDTKTALSSASAIIGINNSATTPGQVISGNSIYNLSTTDAAISSRIRGIIYSGPTSGTNTISKNIIRNIKIASTTGGVLRGIDVSLSGASPVSVENNMISFGNDAAGSAITQNLEIAGIYEAGGTNSFYNNSIHIFGSGVVSGTAGSYAFYSAAAANSKIIKNNIFSNSRSNGAGTGSHYAIYITNTTGLTTDYNNFSATGTGAFLGYYSGNQSTVSDWKTACSQDVNSANTIPTFSSSNDLHLVAASSFFLNNLGVNIAGITTDIDGETRSIYAPDMGYDEIKVDGSWIGVTSGDWNTSSNWETNVVPTSLNNVLVYKAPNYPIVTTSEAITGLYLKSPGNCTLNAGGLALSGVLSTTAGLLNSINGTLTFNGTSPQSISGSQFSSRTIKNLTISNVASLNINATAGDTLKISSLLKFGNVNNSTLNTGGNLVLLSTASATASLGDLTNGGLNSGNSVSGNAIVERYINIGTTAGQHLKGWQLVAAPVTGVSIRNAWMEGGLITSTPNGYGTWMTAPAGVAAGFDGYTLTPSIKTYQPASSSWVPVPSTSADINNKEGYMIFIRGDRSVFNFSGPNSAAVSTVLRAKGQLVTGSQTSLTVAAGGFQSMANPYPSAVDFNTVTFNGGVGRDYKAWDPSLTGTYGLGGYQTITSITGFKPVPGNVDNIPGVTPIYNSATSYQNLQSGQTVFISAGATAGSIGFSESNKATGSILVNREINNIKSIATNLMAVSGTNMILTDGNVAVFDEDYSNDVNADDAIKLLNGGENFGLTRSGESLAAEAKAALAAADTLFYNLSNVRQQAYRLMFIPENLSASGLLAELVDSYLNSRTTVSLTDTNYININFTADALSKAANRFMLVFKTIAAPLPVTIVSISAGRNSDKTITINWAVENQINMDKYEVERSSDGRSFAALMSTIAEGSNNGNSARYSKIDNRPLTGESFYRIKANSLNGQVQYSTIVKVSGIETAAITVYPNPVTGKQMQVRFSAVESGNYQLVLVNAAGQITYKGTLMVNSGSSAKSIQLSSDMAAGRYQLTITAPDGNKYNQPILME